MNEDSNDKLMADAARLARRIAPERDLWPGIEAAIVHKTAAPAHRPWVRYLAQAAAVVVLVGGSSLVTYTLMDAGPGVIERPASEELVLRQASFGGQYELSNDYKRARTDLEAQLDREIRKLSPNARAEVEQNLAVIRGAIAEINAALAQEPGNVLLQDLLLRTYREELAVMRKVGGLTQDVMLRNDI